MKVLKDLKLRKKTEQKILNWLAEWLDLFIEQADRREGNVYRADFEGDDFFFFTECNDILLKDPESESKETNPAIARRKSKVMQQLLIKTLMGEKLGKKLKCSHCGYEDRIIQSMYNGHYTYCPNCGYLVLNGYLDTIQESMKGIIAKRRKGEVAELERRYGGH